MTEVVGLPGRFEPKLVDEFRHEFVHQFQYRFHKQSDHYTIVAMFAAEKVQQALAKADSHVPKGE